MLSAVAKKPAFRPALMAMGVALALSTSVFTNSTTANPVLAKKINAGNPNSANPNASHIGSLTDLEYGTVLFEYYQKDYFNGLIEQEFALATGNKKAASNRGRLFQGGMALSYGLADEAQTTFDELLSPQAEVEEDVRNRAWYYLAKLYHARSEPQRAHLALENIHGNVPADLHLDYHYLATLVNNDGQHLDAIQQAVDKVPTTTPQYPYLLFNLGISYLGNGDIDSAIKNLQRVVDYADTSEELQVLADRARHGLAQLFIQNNQLFPAWNYLQGIRTVGLYSNRALLAYSWAAISQKQYEAAIPALQLLNQRSIALPEVQECKVLLGHLYEQQGSSTRALKNHLQAEKDFLSGIEQVAEARRIIDMRDVPREFIENLESIVDDTDWMGSQPSVDYQKLTPFLIDLMASNAFHQVLSELADLYAIRDNLEFWSEQTDQHEVILDSAANKIFDDDMKQLLKDTQTLRDRLENQQREASLMTLTLDTAEKARFVAMLENSEKELDLLKDKIDTLAKQGEPYQQPAEHPAMVATHHQRITQSQEDTEYYIAKLEPVMRNLVKVELDKHEERMRYYLAQTRLAKARLYDTALTNLDSRQKDTGGAQ